MIGIATYFYRLTFQILTDAAEITVKLLFLRWKDKRFSVFSTKHDMDIIFYEFRWALPIADRLCPFGAF